MGDSHLVTECRHVGSVTHLRLAGPIDETFSLEDRLPELTGHVLVDLGRVERITSSGVSLWMEVTQRLPPDAYGLHLLHLPPVVVDQLNMVEGFAGVAQVHSVLAPYVCVGCGRPQVRVVDVASDAADIEAGRAPEHACLVCGAALTFTDRPEEFFRVFRGQIPPELDPVVHRYLGALSLSPISSPTRVAPRSAEPSGNLKIVQGDLTFFRVTRVLRPDLNVRQLSAGLEGRVAYDFGFVTQVEEGAAGPLRQVLQVAAESATVFLWRVPPAVLDLLAIEPLPPPTLASVFLPCACLHCGARAPQRIEAQTYLAELTAPNPRPCAVCGHGATPPRLGEAAELLRRRARDGVPFAELEAIELRGLRQMLLSSPITEARSGSGSSKGGAAGHAASGSQGGSHGGVTGGSTGSRLHILRRIGRGGMAEVFLARQAGIRGFEKYLVVKKILATYLESPDFVEMLFAEARANARLTHPNVVQTYDVGVRDGVPFITLEYVRGPDLKRLIVQMRKVGKRIPIAHALRIVAETAAGLHHAHCYVDPTGQPHPMVHRDVSPHNILVSLDGAIKLSDFGIARMQGEVQHTRPGTFKGKISYSAPEAIRELPLDGRSDIFSLGVVLYELLTGRLPFKRETDVATFRAILHDIPPLPSESSPEVSVELDALVLKALSKEPEGRFQTADAMREALEHLLLEASLRSSPQQVAVFFTEALGERLAEYGPVLATRGAPADDDGASADRLTPAAPVDTPGFAVESTRDLTASLAPLDLTPLPSMAAAAPGASPALRSAARPASLPPSAPGVVPAAPPPLPTGRALAPITHGKVAWVMGALAGAALLLAGVLAGVPLARGQTAPTRHLAAGEHLYVGGVQVVATTDWPAGVEPRLVAVARDGRLARLGIVVRAQDLDVRALVDVGGGAAGQGRLHVETGAGGCTVSIDGRRESGETPLTTSIDADRELRVEVVCPGKEGTWSREVMAVSGETIELRRP